MVHENMQIFGSCKRHELSQGLQMALMCGETVNLENPVSHSSPQGPQDRSDSGAHWVDIKQRLLCMMQGPFGHVAACGEPPFRKHVTDTVQSNRDHLLFTINE